MGLLHPMWILRGIKIWKCFLKLNSLFLNNTRDQYFYALSFCLFCLFELCIWGAYKSVLFSVGTLIWYSDTNNYLFYYLLFPFDMSQLWSFQRKRHFKLNGISQNCVVLWNKETKHSVKFIRCFLQVRGSIFLSCHFQ